MAWPQGIIPALHRPQNYGHTFFGKVLTGEDKNHIRQDTNTSTSEMAVEEYSDSDIVCFTSINTDTDGWRGKSRYDASLHSARELEKAAVTDHFLLVTHGMFTADSLKKNTGQRIFCSYLWSVYQQVIWEEDCTSSIDISVLNLCPVDIHRQPVIAVIFCNHYAVQSCVSDVTVFGIIPKAHEKYSRAVLSAAELCQLSFQAGGVLFSFSQNLSLTHKHVGWEVILEVCNQTSTPNWGYVQHYLISQGFGYLLALKIKISQSPWNHSTVLHYQD